MQALEQDARIYEARYLGVVQQTTTTRPVLEGGYGLLLLDWHGFWSECGKFNTNSGLEGYV